MNPRPYIVPDQPTYYAIRHKRTGFFLPAQSSYGFTRVEPTPAREAAPRLFSSVGPAKQALTWWLRGEAYETVEDQWNTDGPEREVRLKIIPKANRRADDMEIVAISLVVESLEELALRRL